MAKKTVTKEVLTCDVCRREESYLLECVACRKQYCLTCDAIVPGCMVKPPVCRECGETKARTAAGSPRPPARQEQPLAGMSWPPMPSRWTPIRRRSSRWPRRGA